MQVIFYINQVNFNPKVGIVKTYDKNGYKSFGHDT